MTKKQSTIALRHLSILASFDIRASSFLSLVHDKFVPIRVAKLRHPAHGRFSFFHIERHAAFFELRYGSIDVADFKRDCCSLARRFPSWMTTDSDCYAAKIVLDPRAFHLRARRR